MLLNAIIICCIVIVNAEPPHSSYTLTGSKNGYDYSNTGTSSRYVEPKDNYQNNGNFYTTGDSAHQASSNHINSYSLFNSGNHGSTGDDMGSNYNKYSANNRESEYAGYSKAYENPDSDSYTLPTHPSPVPFRGYSGSGINGDSNFNAYSSGLAHKDSDFGQYAAGSSSSKQRIYPHHGYPRPALLENYSEGNDGDVQGYHGTSGTPSYSESDRVHPLYSSSSLAGEYPFEKQQDNLYNLKGSNKYNDVYSMPTETHYTRGNALHTGHASHNHGIRPYLSGSAPSGHLSKIYGDIYSTGKPYKYKHSTRYVPNSGITYLPRERDSHYAPYGKNSGKVIIIKDSRPSYAGGYVYSDESPYAGGYKSKSGFMSAGGYSTSPNFDGYSGGNNYDDGPVIPKRYRTNGGHMLIQKTIYP